MKKHIVVILAISVIASCNKEKKADKIDCTGLVVSYTNDIAPLVSTKCGGCHNEYGTYTGLKSIADDGSLREQVVVKERMPKDGSLTDEQIRLFKCWIEQGAPNN